MEASRLLESLLDRGIQVRTSGSDLAFRAPRGAWNAELKTSLVEHKAQLRRLLKEGHKHAPASFAQERLWFLDRLEPESAAYNMPEALRLRGEADAARLAAALRQIVRRHEALRTTFEEIGGRPRQIVSHHGNPALALVDLTGLEPARREAEAGRLAGEEALRPFDLAGGPLLRTALLCLAGPALRPRDSVLLRNVHHIVFDGWSEGVFWRELTTFYRSGPLPDLPLQYADFAVRQRRRQGDLAAQLSLWRELLADSPPPLELPTDRPRRPGSRGQGALYVRSLAADLAAGLRSLGQASGASLFMTALAAFMVLLGRAAGRRDVLVGTTVAGRGQPELEALIGFFVNTLVLRARLDGRMTFGELLRQVRETALQAYAHQDVPLERLADELQPRGSSPPTSHTPAPFFRVVFQLHAEAGPPRLPGVAVEPAELRIPPAKFDLVVNLVDGGESGLKSTWHYDPRLFDATTVRRLAERFATLAAAAAADAGRRLTELPLLTPIEGHQLTVEWNDAPAPPAAALCLRLFRARAEAAPESVAVVSGAGESLTYGELRRRANRLAHRLRSLGIGRGSRVGLLFGRSPDAVVAILGTLAAGAAYVPLDPASPAARLALILDEARPAALLTRRRRLQELPARGPRTVCLDDEAEPLGRQPETDPAAEPTGEDAAYVIFTSGSTGRPKGVTVPHANVARLFAATAGRFRFAPSDVWTLFHSYAFDFSVWELWGALAFGGRLVVVPFKTSRSSGAFHRLVCRHGVTVLNQTPSAFRLFAEADRTSRQRATSLRLVIFGGEALAASSLLPWLERHGDQRPELVNMYGITETTVHVTWRRLTAADARRPWRRSVGRPIPGWQAQVLDAASNPAPTGTTGEICVGGPGVARGYLGRPGLTAERFVPARRGGRLYRSGDLGRRLADGEIEVLGRLDTQVQIHGFRVELGEIEARLARHPQVREAVVVARRTSTGETGLVAYLVAGDRRRLGLGEVRSFLAESLPEHMLPAALVKLDGLPLTVNGKVDRRALPPPEGLRPEIGSGFVVPRTCLERFLAKLWGEILEKGPVGVHDDFFELGGNSVKGAVLINRLQQELGEILHVVTIFDYPTVGEMASYLRAEHPGAAALAGETLASTTSEGPAAELDEERIRQFVSAIDPRPAAGGGEKNPPAVFVLAPPRSGTTLLRVMLGGHPRLFAPPELELLSFDTLEARKKAFSGRLAFWGEGLVRAVMAAKSVSAGEAQRLVDFQAARGATCRQMYRQLQSWLGERLLVDKTPSYALDLETLQRAEEYFENPLYVHLTRHSGAVIHSFVEAKLDQLLWRPPADVSSLFGRRELAELHWLVSHRNILRFLERIPRRRRCRVSFEELVKRPEPVLESLCLFLGLDFHPAMAEPYADPAARMTDGIHAESRMLGDVKFHRHEAIDPGAAERWKGHVAPDSLSAATHELAGELGYARAADEAVPMAPRAGRRPDPLPLSFAQQRLWFLHQMVPDEAAYNMPAAFDLAGRVDVAVLGSAFTEIVRRHETLRTTFPTVGGQAQQAVAPPAAVELPLVDLAHLPRRRRQTVARRLIQEEALRPFDLARGPLLRLALLRLGARRHVLFLNLHHIVSDGWSLGVLYRELSALFRAVARGETSPLPRLPVQYADYAVWERQWLSGNALRAALDYWRRQLDGLSYLELPADRPRPTIRRDSGASHDLDLGADLTSAVTRLSLDRGVSVYMTLLAAYVSLLYRWTGAGDVAVGSPIAHRNRREVEGLIGFFVNTLVMRVDPESSASFLEVLAEVRRVALEAYAHQDLPFEKLVEELTPERDTSRHPLFQVTLAMANTESSELSLPGVAVQPVELEVQAARFDLELFMSEAGGELHGALVYSTDLFDASTAARLVRRFEILLRGVVAEPERRVAEAPLLSRAERQQLLVEYNDTGAGLRDYRLHGLFEIQAEATPDAVAMVDDSERWTYRQLNSRANQLAHHLRAVGVGPDSFVGVCLERSFELAVALLGTLKAGGAFVAFDPDHPRKRLAFLLEDSRVRLLLSQERLLGHLPFGETGIIALDRDWTRFSHRREDNLTVPVNPGNAAYMIYTSGSTGRPKAVVNTHAGIVNQLLWLQATYPLDGKDRMMQKTPVTFDVSIRETFWPLLAGARLVLGRPGGHRDPRHHIELVAREEITVLYFVPSMLAIFLDEPDVERCSSLRWVICGGESLSEDLRRRFHERFPGRRLYNFYGPSEAAIVTASWLLRSGDAHSRVPIGRPVANTRIHLLDAEQMPVPLGAVGELHLGGAQIARGYSRRPQLTAERFVPDRFNDLMGERLYRTGDLGRRLPDGALELEGRIDHQIKFRGVRLELGEIEHQLRRHPAVQDAVAAVRSDMAVAQLVAYVVESRRAREELREEQISVWRNVHEGFFEESSPDQDGRFNIQGWDSSLTRRPIPAQEMREWLDNTVERILATQPQRVFEIGCGTGLLLFSIAPLCADYLGTDFARTVLDSLESELRQPGRELPQVRLLARRADDFDGIEAGAFDTVILNSVVQYFPDVDYLLRVLSGAAESLAPGGVIFVGDVRSLPLLDAYCAAVELYQAPDSLSLAELRSQSTRRRFREEELILDPLFFRALPRHLPRIRNVRILPKSGKSLNELTQFRYDVILQLDGSSDDAVPGDVAAEVTRLDWREDELTLPEAHRYLVRNRPRLLHLQGVPNSRLAVEMRLLELLASSNDAMPVRELRRALQKSPPDGVEPDAVAASIRELPYEVELSWAEGRPDGAYDAFFWRSRDAARVMPPWKEPTAAKPWSAYSNDPVRERAGRRLEPQLREHLRERLPEYVLPSTIVLLDALPLLPNGKLDRAALSRSELAPAPGGRARPHLKETFQGPRNSTEKNLALIWAQLLSLDEVGVHDNFFTLGGDSILSIRVVARANEKGLRLSPRDLFQHQTVAELAAFVDSVEPPNADRRARPQQSLVTGPVPLTPIQRWFFERQLPDPGQYNLSTLLATRPLDSRWIEQSLAHLIRHHETLRLRYTRESRLWRQEIAGLDSSVPFMRVDLSHLDRGRWAGVIERAAADLHRSLDLEAGPLVRVIYFVPGQAGGKSRLAAERPGRLLMVIHHLAMDRVSRPILIEDLELAYRQMAAGQPAALPAKTTSFKDWAERLARLARSEQVNRELAGWLHRLRSTPLDPPKGTLQRAEKTPPRLPVDFSAANTLASAENLSSSLGTAETHHLLRRLPAAYGIRIFEVLLAAFVRALGQWTGHPSALVELKGHGRENLFEDVDLSRTVGWFTSTFPAFLTLEGTAGEQESLMAIREQLAAVPRRGIGYGLLRYLSEDPEIAGRLRSLPQPEIMFNYLGQIEASSGSDSLFEYADESPAPPRGRRGSRSHLLELISYVRDGRLRTHWIYSRNVHRPSTIESLARSFTVELERFAAA